MIYTGLMDITPLLEKDIYDEYYEMVPAWRREKADAFENKIDSARSIGVWSLYQMMCSEYGLGENQVYNLSHAGNYALCSIYAGKEDSVKVGCDVEVIRNMQMAIMTRFFCLIEERSVLAKETEELQKEEFYRYWVLKESFIKAIRKGMGQDLRGFEIRMDENDHPYLRRQPVEFPEKYYYKEYKVPNGDAKVAVCSTDSEFAEMKIYKL